MFPSMRVLVFGSLFGFGASLTCNRNTIHKTMTMRSCTHVILLCSSVMEYCMWPLVFSGSTTGGKQHRIILNTILSESAAVVTSYAAASLINPHNLYDVVCRQVLKENVTDDVRLFLCKCPEIRATRSDRRCSRCFCDLWLHVVSSRRFARGISGCRTFDHLVPRPDGQSLLLSFLSTKRELIHD